MSGGRHDTRRTLGRAVLVLVTSFVCMTAHAQTAPDPIGDFLIAFRGKPVAPITPPQVAPSVASQPPPSVGDANQSAPRAPETDVSAYAPSCPPGVDRIGCRKSSASPQQGSCPVGTIAGPGGCVPTAMPPHAHRVSEDGQWQCDEGFLRFGAICTAIQSTPVNAHLSGVGSDWECNTGFRRVANTCVAVNLPPNAHLANTWNGWECDQGYRKIGEWCAEH